MTIHRSTKLKLGKGARFVKTKLKPLPQEDGDIWQVDFAELPPSPVHPKDRYWTITVLSKTDDFLLAHNLVNEPPNVNDLASTLAEAMFHPLVGDWHRPGQIEYRDQPESIELLPHLKDIGIHCVPCQRLDEWDAEMRQYLREVGEAGMED